MAPRQAVGTFVHAGVERVLRRTRDGHRDAGRYEAMLEDVRSRWQDLLERDLNAFRARPKLGALDAHYYGEPLPESEIAYCEAILRSACRRAVASDLLENVRLLGRRDVCLIEALLSPTIEVDGQRLTLYGKADLAFVLREAVRFDDPPLGIVPPGPTGIPFLVDWKTSTRADLTDARIRRQVAVSALVAVKAHVLQLHPQLGVVVRVGLLGPRAADDPLDFVGQRELQEAARWVGSIVREMLALPRDEHGVPLRAACAPSIGPHCTRCPMRRACEMSLEQDRQALEVPGVRSLEVAGAAR